MLLNILLVLCQAGSTGMSRLGCRGNLSKDWTPLSHNFNNGDQLNRSICETHKHSIWIVLILLLLYYSLSRYLPPSLLLTLVACFKGYEGVKSTMSYWPTAMCSCRALYCIFIAGNTETETEGRLCRYIQIKQYKSLNVHKLDSCHHYFLSYFSYCFFFCQTVTEKKHFKELSQFCWRLERKLNLEVLELFFPMRVNIIGIIGDLNFIWPDGSGCYYFVRVAAQKLL